MAGVAVRAARRDGAASSGPGPGSAAALLEAPGLEQRAPDGEPFRLHLRILLPFTLLLGFVIALFLITTYVTERADRRAELSARVQAVDRLFRHEVEEDAKQMHGTLDALLAVPEMRALFRARDRDGLLARARPLFEALRRDHSISQFSFLLPGRTVLLRVHRPGAAGDRVDRTTVRRAERTRQVAYGIELGTFGMLTMRVVMPWVEDGRLLGYVELGHEVRHFLTEIRDILGMDVVVLIYKRYLGYLRGAPPSEAQARWPWPWERFATMVAVASTTRSLPAAITAMFEEDAHPYQAVVPIERGERRTHVAFLPLYDAAEREIGDIAVIHDITGEERAFRKSMIATGAVSLAAGGAVFALFVLTLNRVARDYRRKREVEARLSRLSAEHERIVQVEKLSAIGTMIGEIAHQINNPMVGVVNMAQLALREVDDPERTRKRLEDIVAAGKHCHAFVKRMTDFTRAARSERRVTDLRGLLDEAVTLFRQSARGRPRVHCRLPAEPVRAAVDATLVRHAVFNLLHNAVQAQIQAGREREPVTVDLHARLRVEDGALGWALVVEDHGTGLSPEVAERMFAPFFTTRPEGTGLGLPVVRYVARIHGGSVTGENREGGGARFTLWLPAAEEAGDDG